MGTLYERLGGEAAVIAAVDLFYDKVLEDPVTSPFFEQLNIDAQIKKQVAFMTRAFGGPEQYQGRNLREAHARLVQDRGLTDVHFDAVATHLKSALEELNDRQDLIQEVLALVGSTRQEVLGR